MSLSSGMKLGPYEVQAPLGAGGMGEVYRARDTRLERNVAIKILPAHLSGDPARKQAWLWWALAGLLTSIAIVTIILWRHSLPSRQPTYFFAPLPLTARDIALAPNGRTAAIVAYQQSARKNVIWLYDVGAQGARNLPNTEGADYPFWSPDERSIGFFAEGRLKKIDLASGQVRIICDAPSGRGGAWNKDDTILFSPHARQGGLVRIAASGGDIKPVTRPDQGRGESSHRWPVFLPDGNHFLYMAATFSGIKEVDAIFVGALDSDQRKFITAADANAAYAEPGYLIFYRNNTLLAQGFDLRQFALKGEPTDLLSGMQFIRQVKRIPFAVSDDGLLLAQAGDPGMVGLSQPKWFDRTGRELGALDKPGVYGNVSIGPGGRTFAADNIDLSGSMNMDIWIYDSWQNVTPRRFTFDPGYDGAAVWRPDGRQVLFSSNRKLLLDLYVKNEDGAQDEHSVSHDSFDKLANDWSRDGKYILYRHADELWYSTVPDFIGKAFLKSSGILQNGQFSPDGKWVAYNSNETGTWEIYVTSFPDAEGKWQISAGSGEQPRWRGDGKELFFLSSDGRVMAAPVSTGIHFSFGTPVALFQANPRQPVSYLDIFSYDVARDGQKFLINTEVRPADAGPVSVLLNWPAKLQK